jgi:uncharacterized repeat protein (TIGR01451 family)
VGTLAGRFSIDSGSDSITLASGESRTITVSFVPQGWVGDALCQLNLLTNSVARPSLTALLTAKASGPEIDLTPPSPYSFGWIMVGESRWRDFMVANLGNRDLLVSATVLGGANPDQFSIDDGAAPFLVSPGSSHAVQVWCSPDSLGEKSAFLTITSNDPDEGTFQLELDVEGVLPQASFETDELDFGAVPVAASLEKVIGLSNLGKAILEVSVVDLLGGDTGDFSVVRGGGKFQVWPGATRLIRIAFAPSQTGLRQTALQVTSNDPERPVIEATITGTGVRSQLQIEKTCKTAPHIVQCTLTVANPGETAAPGMTVTDSLPAGLIWLADDCAAGPPDNNVLTWVRPLIAQGETVQCRLRLAVDAGAPEEMVNVATVASDYSLPGAADDTSSAVIQRQPTPAIPDLSVPGWLALALLLSLLGTLKLRRLANHQRASNTRWS